MPAIRTYKLLQDVVIISLSCNTFNSLLSYLSSCQIDVLVSSTVKALTAGSRNGQDCWIARYIAINMFQGPSATDYSIRIYTTPPPSNLSSFHEFDPHREVVSHMIFNYDGFLEAYEYKYIPYICAGDGFHRTNCCNNTRRACITFPQVLHPHS